MAKSLYELALDKATDYATQPDVFPTKVFRLLPNTVLVDLYYSMYERKQSEFVFAEICDPAVLMPMLLWDQSRVKLLKLFNMAIDGKPWIAMKLVSRYNTNDINEKYIQDLLNYGIFLVEGFWMKQARMVLMRTLDTLMEWRTEDEWAKVVLQLNCIKHLFWLVFVVSPGHPIVEEMYNASNENMRWLKDNAAAENKKVPSFAAIFVNMALFHMHRKQPDAAYEAECNALSAVDASTSKSDYIFVLRFISKIRLVNGKNEEAMHLLKEAFRLARNAYEFDEHPRYSDTLVDCAYGLRVNGECALIGKLSRIALNTRKKVFGNAATFSWLLQYHQIISVNMVTFLSAGP